MLNDITNWFITTSYLEMLGMLVATAIVLGAVYLIYEVVRQLANLYIQMKLVELYKQKDRLWEAYQDLYDNYEDLKEYTWDYQITKDNLKLLTKDVEAVEEYLLDSDFVRKEVDNESK